MNWAFLQLVINPETRLLYRLLKSAVSNAPDQSKDALKVLVNLLQKQHRDAYVAFDLQLQHHGFFNAAQSVFNTVCETEPFDRQRVLELCQNALLQGNYEIANVRWTYLLDQEPTNLGAKKVLIDIMLKQGKVEAAQERVYCAKESSDNVVFDLAQFSLYLAQGKGSEANNFLDNVIDERLDNVNFATHIAGFLLQVGRHEDVEPLLTALLESHPDNYGILFKLAQAAFRRRSHALAARRLEILIDKNPSDVNARSLYIRCLLEIEGAESAQTYLNSLKESFEDYALWLSEIRILLSQRNQRKTLDYINNKLAKNAVGTVPWGVLQGLYIQKINILMHMSFEHSADERYAEVHRVFDEILLFRPMDQDVKKLYCDVLIAQGRNDEAEDIITSLPIWMDQLTVELHMWRLKNAGDNCGAKEVWRKYCTSVRIPQIQQSDPEALERLDDKIIKDGIGEVTLITVIKDEYTRLSWFLGYYRKLGVDRFIFIDNGSQDNSRKYLLEQPDVHLYLAHDPYYLGYDGVKWINDVANKHVTNGWVLYVDVDEALIFPGVESKGIHELTAYLDDHNQEAVSGMMLDMFADKTQQPPDTRDRNNYLDAYPFYENSYQSISVKACPYKYQIGGFRRHFEVSENMTKTPLFRGGRDISLMYSSHSISPAVISDVTCVLLHFKFTDQMVDVFSKDISENSRTALCNSRHKSYLRNLENNNGRVPVDRKLVLRYENSAQLMETGLIQCPEDFLKDTG